jgi:hypothetical protein
MIELPYGEKFPPIGEGGVHFPEPILLNTEYLIQAGGTVTGKCILTSVIEIVENSFDLKSVL